MFIWREQLPADADGYGLDRGFTDRGPADRENTSGLELLTVGENGPGLDSETVGEDDFGDCNLGLHVGDDPPRVLSHRVALAGAIGVDDDRLVFMQQCHGVDVEVVDGPRPAPPSPADGVVTCRTDLALAVLVADCTPVLLADRDAGVVAAVHAGRPGMVGGVVGRAVDAMRDLGARSIEATVGPSVCGRCYEVPAAMRDEAARTSAVSATVSWRGTPAIDVAAGVVDQLRAKDVAVSWIPGCTRESSRLYSYRRHHVTGRFAGVIRLVAPEGAAR